MNREGPGTFHGEGLVVLRSDTPGVHFNLRAALQALATDDNTTIKQKILMIKQLFMATVIKLLYEPFNAFNQRNGKTIVWKTVQTRVMQQSRAEIRYTKSLSGGKYETFQLSSALISGSADKYLPMLAINGMCIVMSCENATELL